MLFQHSTWFWWAHFLLSRSVRGTETVSLWFPVYVCGECLWVHQWLWEPELGIGSGLGIIDSQSYSFKSWILSLLSPSELFLSWEDSEIVQKCFPWTDGLHIRYILIFLLFKSFKCWYLMCLNGEKCVRKVLWRFQCPVFTHTSCPSLYNSELLWMSSVRRYLTQSFVIQTEGLAC